MGRDIDQDRVSRKLIKYVPGEREWPGHLYHDARTSLVVQWLRIYVFPMQGAWVRPLVGELRSHMPCSVTKMD